MGPQAQKALLSGTLLFLLIGLAFPAVAQDQPEPHKTLDITASDLTVDNLGWVYLVNEDEITRCDKNGVSNYTFSDKTLGAVTSIDVSQPLKVLVFYRELNRIAFLDNKLAVFGEPVHLDMLGFDQATLACSSFNNGIWLYDQLTFELIRLDQNLKELYRTGNINQLTGRHIEPNFLVESNNWIYLNDPGSGVLVFDIFGTYYKTIPLPGLQRFQVVENRLYYPLENKIASYDLNRSRDLSESSPELDFQHFGVSKDRFFFLVENRLLIYTRKP